MKDVCEEIVTHLISFGGIFVLVSSKIFRMCKGEDVWEELVKTTPQLKWIAVEYEI